MNVEYNKQNYNSIDLMKFIMAFAVVAIHTQPLNNCRNRILILVYNNIVEIAVPLFFLSSGYLLSKRMTFINTDSDINILTKHLNKIIKLYVKWMLIYTPLEIYKDIMHGNGIVKSILIYFRGFLFVGEQYNSWHLWYLLSTIYSLILIIILYKLKIFRNMGGGCLL